MAEGPPSSSRPGPALQTWMSKYGTVGRLVFEAKEINFEKPVKKKTAEIAAVHVKS